MKFAIISFTENLAPSSATEVSFQNTASCNNAGYLGQAQMTGFNGGNWGAQIVVTPAGGTAVITDAKTMLAASDPNSNTFGDCKNDYWLRGPVVTAVIVQDCTRASSFDFGWLWDGSTMNANSGNPYTTSSVYASIHPMFILYFYPGLNAVEAITGMRISRGRQDRSYKNLVLRRTIPTVRVVCVLPLQPGPQPATHVCIAGNAEKLQANMAKDSATAARPV